MEDLRCKRCNKKVAEAEDGKVAWVCPRCRTYNTILLTKSGKDSISKTVAI